MRYPKIIDELNDSVSSIVQLVLTIPNPIDFVKNYDKNWYIIIFQDNLLAQALQNALFMA